MDTFQEFPDLFEDMKYVVFRALFNREDEALFEPWMETMYEPWKFAMFESIRKVKEGWQPNLVDKDDAEQEIRCVWLKCQQADVSKSDLRKNLIRRTIWGMRDWAKKQAKLAGVISCDVSEQEPDLGFTLDLAFLLYGVDLYPLSSLTDFERYLLYLRYKEGKTLDEVSKIVHKHHATIQSHLRDIFDKLRSLNNEQNTSGHSNG